MSWLSNSPGWQGSGKDGHFNRALESQRLGQGFGIVGSSSERVAKSDVEFQKRRSTLATRASEHATYATMTYGDRHAVLAVTGQPEMRDLGA